LISLKNKIGIKPVEGVMVNVARFLMSATFIFSGFVKALDPKGTGYKLDAYVGKLGLSNFISDDVTLAAGVVLASMEFLLGIYLLFGIRRRFTTSMLLVVMLFFTPFTLYLALANPVHDCGCFGDAIILTNWQTFWKNLILLAFALLTFYRSGKMFRLVPPSVHWAYSLFSMIYIVAICLFSIHYLPLIDMRPYKVSVNIRKAMEIPAGAKEPVYDNVFVMEKNGVKKEFNMKNYPDSTWTYVSGKSVLKEKGYVPPITDFNIVDTTGNDITAQILNDTTLTFVLVSPHLEDADTGVTDELNVVHDYCMDHNYKMIGLTASGDDAIAKWRYQTGAVYPIYFMDEVVLKTIVRSNPGLLLLRQGTILNKWSCNNLPELDVSEKKSKAQIVPGVSTESSIKVLLKVELAYIIPLLFITLALNLRRVRRRV
jgi:uncharacterized membrane protein YphA (DoxX/SURF4 family)